MLQLVKRLQTSGNTDEHALKSAVNVLKGVVVLICDEIKLLSKFICHPSVVQTSRQLAIPLTLK